MPIALVLLGAIVIVAVAARYAPAAAESRSRQAVLDQCAQLTAQLAAVRQQGGDVGQAAQIQAQLDACVTRANALGAGLDASAAKLVQADSANNQIESEFAHLRSTDYADWLKRENTFATMMRIADDMARIYDDALNSAETRQSVSRIRSSLLRSIDASIQRRNCFASKAPGCDRSGPAELSAEAKSYAELDRVVRPLSAIYRRAMTKLAGYGGTRADWDAGAETYGSRDFGAVLLTDCTRLIDGVRAKFAELQATGYEDPMKRGRIIADLFQWERAMVECIRGALDAAKADASPVGLTAVERAASLAYDDSIGRRTCFASGAAGCGRSSPLEGRDDEKAASETANATEPLAQIVREAAAARAAINIDRAALDRAVVAGSRGRINVGRIG